MSATTEQRVLLGLAIWLFLFGMWPFADPGHRGWSPMTMADLTIHSVALGYLVHRAVGSKRWTNTNQKEHA